MPTSATLSTPARTGTFFDIEMLPAGHGDALWIEYGDGNGLPPLARRLRNPADIGTSTGDASSRCPTKSGTRALRDVPHRLDHIGGALPFLHAAKQACASKTSGSTAGGISRASWARGKGEMFSTAIEDLDLPWNEWRERGTIVVDGDALPVSLPGGMKLTLLSPGPAQLRSWPRCGRASCTATDSSRGRASITAVPKGHAVDIHEH